jgi:hypothetical protein
MLACLENQEQKIRVRGPALHLALHPRPLPLPYSRSLNLAFILHGLWLSRPLLQDSVLYFLHLFVCLSLCSYYSSMHCLRSFQLNETETLFTCACHKRIWNVSAWGNDKGTARNSRELELGPLSFLPT